MAKSRSEINQESNERRGIVSKSYKLHESTVEQIKSLSESTGESQAKIITEAVKLYVEQLNKPD
ncbi:hypothetical protein [Acinetobacter sp. CE-15]|uniref:hypothetical protein n=1 Tax=Acinetobacter sp. CE-15 TaxID=3425693 RepID=UPI003DA4260A